MPLWTLDPFLLACALLLALAIDGRWGEPPAAFHPVVWMGRALGWTGMRIAPLQATGRDIRSFCAAAIFWCALAAIVLIVSGALQWVAITLLPVWGAALVVGLLLKPMLAWRMLRGEVLAVEDALAQSLDAGRERLSWLVSRDVQGLDAAAVRESAIESLAENLSDSVIAPLFWFVLLGLPGAALYRFANTADAMWGYPGMRGGRYWQWAGKWAARADDVLSWLPARITAVLLWGVSRGNGARWTDLRAQSRLTPSPNGGWPMGAMALALGVRLSKPGVYVLNAPGRAPQAADTQRAVHLASKTLLALVVLAVTALLLIAIVHTHV